MQINLTYLGVTTLAKQGSRHPNAGYLRVRRIEDFWTCTIAVLRRAYEKAQGDSLPTRGHDEIGLPMSFCACNRPEFTTRHRSKELKLIKRNPTHFSVEIGNLHLRTRLLRDLIVFLRLCFMGLRIYSYISGPGSRGLNETVFLFSKVSNCHLSRLSPPKAIPDFLEFLRGQVVT